jgi:uncharacterized protein DUF5666
MKGLVIALAIVVGVLGGFYGGYKVGQNNVTASTASTTGNRTTGGAQFANGRGAFASACPSPGAPSPSPGSQTFARGTVTNLGSTSMTVSQPGCDVKVTFTPTTTVQKTVPGSTSDLTDNQTVTVAGTRQPDGSVQAQAIQIGGARGPGAGANPGGGG